MSGLDPHQRAQRLSTEAEGFLNRGMYTEAERLYRLAASADSHSSQALVGLAHVLEHQGNSAGARAEAQAALAIGDSAGAWVVLAEIDLAAGRTAEARQEAENALRIEPANESAQTLLKQIQTQPQRP